MDMSLTRVPGPDNLFVGGIWILNLASGQSKLQDAGVTHVLSAIKFSLDKQVQTFRHMSIDVDDVDDTDLLMHFPAAVRFIDEGLGHKTSSDADEPGKGVYVHCAMGRSRSVSCTIAYLLHKYPHRYGGEPWSPTAAHAAKRRAQAGQVVANALESVRETRGIAGPNEGFMRQLELWWEMGCPAEEGVLERHPTYQRWLYDGILREARDARMAPELENIRFEDEVEAQDDTPAASGEETQSNQGGADKEARCKRCRRVLATPRFIIPHSPKSSSSSINCAHLFIETLSWMRPALEEGALDGRLNCPNPKCGATVGRYAWQGLNCTCREWVVPAFSLNRSRVDEVTPRRTPGLAGQL